MKIVTYSRNVFIPLTRNCRNNCAYCGFRSDHINIMDKEDVRKLLSIAGNAKEALFTFGEKPDEVYPEIRKWLRDRGYRDFVDYIAAMNRLAIDMGLLPHTNAGILSM